MALAITLRFTPEQLSSEHVSDIHIYTQICLNNNYCAPSLNLTGSAFSSIFFSLIDPLSDEQRQNMSRGAKLNERRLKDRGVGPMFPETRRLLEEFFRPCNEDLAKLLNDDRFLWRH